jgi:phosphinothricin acetyltransferase
MHAIRHAARADAEAIAAIYRPAVVGSAISFETDAPGADEMERRVTTTFLRAPWLVCTLDDVVAGYVYAAPHHERAAYQWSTNVAVYVRADQHRRGIGRALYTSLFALLRLQGYCAAHACITLPNPASVGLHEALGFRPVALYPAVGFKAGAWRDVGYWQLPLRERIDPPGPIRPVRELETSEAYRLALASGLALVRAGTAG